MMLFGLDVADSLVVKTGAGVSSLTGGLMLAQQTLPIPDDLKTWPVTAMLCLVALSALGMAAGTSYMAFKSLIRQAEKLSEVATAQHETNETLTQVCAEMRQTNLNLAARPCIRP